MSEPVGLNMSLDDLIKKRSQGTQRGQAQRGGGQALRGLGPRGGGVHKHQERKPFVHQRSSGEQLGRHSQHGQNKPLAQRGGFGGRHGGQGHQRRGGFGSSFGQRQQSNGTTPLHNSVQTYLDETTGNVVVRLKDTEVVTIRPTGDIVLTTGGWFTTSTLEVMNKALGVLQIRVTANGDVRDGAWQISYGAHLLRFYDGIILHPKNPATAAQRAPMVLAAMTGVAPVAAGAASFGATPGLLVPSATAGMGVMGHNPLAASAAAASSAAAAALAANVMARARAALGLGAASGLGGGVPNLTQAQQQYALAALAAQQNQSLSGFSGAVEEAPADADTIRRLKAQGRL